MTDYYPLLLSAVSKPKVWGGRNLERLLGKSFAPDELIGETWEASDECVIANGAFEGMTLKSLVERDAVGIVGAGSRGDGFPLLFKFIDAQDDLSVQVHPDDAAAQAMEHYPFGKTEAWYIIHAEPDGALIHGFNYDVDAAHVFEAIAGNKLTDLVCRIPVQSGDVVFVPAGTVHAILRGVVLAEIQENSDITYRMYDWGRAGNGRELHIEKSLRVAYFKKWSGHKVPRLTIRREEFDRHFLVACRYFSYERVDLRGPARDLALEKATILSVISGSADIAYGQRLGFSVRAGIGQTVVLPARLGPVEIAPIESTCQLLRAYIPDLRTDVIEPLKRAGLQTDRIVQLGGGLAEKNDISSLV